MAITTQEYFFNSRPGKAVVLKVTWETIEELGIVFSAMLEHDSYRILGCEFDFVWKNGNLWFSMAKERNAFKVYLEGREAQHHIDTNSVQS